MMDFLGMSRGEVSQMDDLNAMDIDSDYAQVLAESIHGESSEDRLVDANFYDEFDDDLDDDDLE